MLKKLFNRLSSVRFALALLVAITLASFIGMVFSIDKYVWWGRLKYSGLGKFLGLEDIFATTWFAILIGLFFLNTLACTMRQLRVAQNKGNDPQSERALFINEIASDRDLAVILERVGELLRERKYKVVQCTGKDLVIGQRGHFARWGSVVFHSGLLLMVIGAGVGLLGGYKGIFALTEGYSFNNEPAGYVTYSEGPLLFYRQSYSMVLEDFNNEYTSKDYPTEFKAQVKIYHGKKLVREGEITEFEPFRHKGSTLYLFPNYGYTPKLKLELPGLPVMNNFFMLPTDVKDEDYVYEKNKGELPGGYLVTVKFIPDYDPRAAEIKTKSHRLDNPAVYVLVEKGDVELFKDVIPIGNETRQGDITVGFPEIRRWLSFKDVYNPGLPVLLLGSFILIAGLALFYLVPSRTIVFQVEEPLRRVTLGARFERFPALQNEAVEELWQEIIGVLDQKGNFQ